MISKAKVYLAGRYQEQAVMRECRDAWSDKVTVTSRWIDGKHDGVAPQTCCLDDLADIDAADALVLWNPKAHHGNGRGGRHVELGYALAREKRVIIVGDRENVFHWHPTIEHVAEFPDAFTLLTKDRP